MTSARAEYQRRYRQENRNVLLEKKRIYYLENRQRILQRVERNRDHKRQYDRDYHRRHRSKNREKRNAYQRRFRSDPTKRLAHNLRNRISKFVRRKSRRSGTQELLGCTFKQFAEYIEGQFRLGMGWQNYGKMWHIDHIIPMASFDLSDPRQLRLCCHFSNLRPLLARENLRKNARLVDSQFRLPL